VAEKSIKRSDVPDVVLTAAAARYPKARMVRFTEDRVRGQPVYAVTLGGGGRKSEIILTSGGKVLTEGQILTARELPEAVRAGLEASRYARATVRRIARVVNFEKSEPPTFALRVTQSGKVHELVFERTGALAREEAVGLASAAEP